MDWTSERISCILDSMRDWVILAAGDGTRMGSDRPKPLIMLNGQPLLGHVLMRLAEARPRRVIVVTGYKHELVERFLQAERFPFDLVTVVNREYWKENGYSLLRAAPLLQEPFLLAMADHIVDPEIYARAAAHEGLGLCVDTAPPSELVAEATKVAIADGWIIRLGKNLREWDGLDVGVFRLTPIIFNVLRELIASRGDATLTEAVNGLITRGERIAAIDVTGLFWFDIDTPEDLQRAASLLK